MADITVVVIGVAVAVAVVVIVLFGVLFVYCRRRVKKGTNIRRRVVEDEEIVKVRPPLDIPPRQEMIQDVIYRPPTPPPPRDAYLERRGSWPKRDPNPDYVIVHKKHHHGRHRRRPSFEADRRIYRSGTRGDSYSSSSEDESESAHSGTHMRGARPMPVYPQPYPVPVATTLVPSGQPIPQLGPVIHPTDPNTRQTQGQAQGYDKTFFWRPTERTNEYAIGGADVAFT